MAAEWNMHAVEAPLFAEYLQLAEAAGWGELLHRDRLQIGPNDALVIVDMQNDFVPRNAVNQHGGAFAVAEGANITPLIQTLTEQFAEAGAMVIATRDYHPKNHCSFIEQSGPFPKHCVQGSTGSLFYDPIGETLMKQKLLGRRVSVVFKGYHSDVDSFGSFPYPAEGMFARVAHREPTDPGASSLHGCTLTDWTGAVCLECSSLEDDINAPPDILSVYSRVTLAERLKSEKIERIFACGLALDFCVLDTTVNARKAGFAPVYMLLDAARAAHLPGVGKIGTGFLQDPVELKAKMKECGVQILACSSLLSELTVVNAASAGTEIPASFPVSLGPFALVPAKKLILMVNRETLTYKAFQPIEMIETFQKHGLQPEGRLAPITPVTLDKQSKEELGLPQDAVEFAWAYPVGGGQFSEQARAYLSTTTPSAAFFVYGGYIYFNDRGSVVLNVAVALGAGLQFDPPSPWPPGLSSALGDRWQVATIPFLQEKGVKKFAWVNPSEAFKDANGEERMMGGVHGGFVYLFNEDLQKDDSRNVIFQVAKLEQKRPAVGRVGAEEDMDASVFQAVSQRAAATTKQRVLAKFKEWDQDGTGRLSHKELVRAIQRLDPNITEDQLRRMFRAADADKDGLIDAHEFLNWLYKPRQ